MAIERHRSWLPSTPSAKRRHGRGSGVLAAVLLASALANAAVFDVTLDPDPPAACDGVNDDWGAIQAAIDLAAADGGGSVYVPTGTCRVGSVLRIESDDIVIQGDGAGSRLLAPAGGTTLLFIDGHSRILLRDLHIAEQGVAAHGDAGIGSGIRIQGRSDEITIRNVRVTGFAHGIAARELESTGGIENLTLRDVWVEHSSSWGIELAGVLYARLFDVRVTGAGLDGLKIGRPTRYLEVHGGRFWNNGSNGLGDGIDLFSGGNKWLIAGTRVDGNAAEGINVKSGTVTSGDAPIAEGSIVGVVSENNGINGINVFSFAADGDPTPHHIRVTGGVLARNGESGIRIGAGRNVTLSGVVVKENGRTGVVAATGSLDISMVGLQVSANGNSPPQRWSGIRVDADRVRLIGGVVNGNNHDVAVVDPCADSAGCPISHSWSLELGAGASETLVSGAVFENTATGAQIKGAGAVVENVVGARSRASGVVRLPRESTWVSVAHGLATTPRPAQLSVTPIGDWGAASRYWIGSPTPTTFRVNVDAAPGIDLYFRWSADASGR